MRAPDIETLLRPAAGLLDDPDHWRGASDGLAVFVANDNFHSYRVPVVFDEAIAHCTKVNISSGDLMLGLELKQEDLTRLTGAQFALIANINVMRDG